MRDKPNTDLRRTVGTLNIRRILACHRSPSITQHKLRCKPHSILSLFLKLVFPPSPPPPPPIFFFLRNAVKHATLDCLRHQTDYRQIAPGQVSIVRDSAALAVSTAVGYRLFEAAVTSAGMVSLTLC